MQIMSILPGTSPHPNAPRTLAIDIGATGLKMIILDRDGKPMTRRDRELTPRPGRVADVLKVLHSQLQRQGAFDRVAVGFPGVVIDNRIQTAPNLHPDWQGFDLVHWLEKQTHQPVRMGNDADVQGLGLIEGVGMELVLTLGTGVGSAAFINGQLVPNLELAHHLFRKEQTYEQWIGKRALEQIGLECWRGRVQEVIEALAATWSFDHLWLGGGERSVS